MLILRLKQCENAVSDGRLDEAFELVRRGDLRLHRRGQDLVTSLTHALVDRGRGHLAAGRLTPASADADKAAYLAGNQPDVAQLREAVNFALKQAGEANRQVAQAVAAARFHADNGQLTVGQNLLDGAAAADVRVAGMKQNLAARRASLESCLVKANEALEAGDWESAVEHLAAQGSAAIGDGQFRVLCNKTAGVIVAKTSAAIESGRLDLAGVYIQNGKRLPVHSVELDSLAGTLEQFRLAYAFIQAGQADQAQQALTRLLAQWPSAVWISPLVEQAKQMGAALTALHGSPLAVSGATVLPGPHPKALPPRPIFDPEYREREKKAGGDRFVLHVDGVGSFLVVTQASVTLGAISASRYVDVPLILEPSVGPVTLTRQDGDYFLKSPRPVAVNDQPTAGKLLTANDRISLGTRCRIIFRRPSAASGSAVLELSGARLADAAIRQVVLMDREIIVGPGVGSHVQTGGEASLVILQRRGADWICRSAAGVSVDGKPAGNAAEFAPGAHLTVGVLGLAVVRDARP